MIESRKAFESKITFDRALLQFVQACGVTGPATRRFFAMMRGARDSIFLKVGKALCPVVEVAAVESDAFVHSWVDLSAMASQLRNL